jgi:hypothetical protein
MEMYFAQKAQQALEALCRGESLPERLKVAKLHFGLVASDKILRTAPEDVRTYVTAFVNSDVEHDMPAACEALQSAIVSILTECGRHEIRTASNRE